MAGTTDERTDRLVKLFVHLVGHATCTGYVISLTSNGPKDNTTMRSITCLTCAMTSFNIEDIERLYCGHCHIFHESVDAELPT